MRKLKKFGHTVMQLHGERAKAYKEQVKDVSVLNVREHKEGEGGERTSARTREVGGLGG